MQLGAGTKAAAPVCPSIRNTSEPSVKGRSDKSNTPMLESCQHLVLHRQDPSNREHEEQKVNNWQCPCTDSKSLRLDSTDTNVIFSHTPCKNIPQEIARTREQTVSCPSDLSLLFQFNAVPPPLLRFGPFRR